ncbi:TPA: hypothetical protein ACX6NV_004020 [Photobacterium damselae]
MPRGGYREGSGRKKGEPSQVIRVPSFLVDHVKGLIARYKSDPELYQAVFSMSHEEVLSHTSRPVVRSGFTKKPSSKRKKKK